MLQTAMCCLQLLGKLKCLATGLDSFLRREGVLGMDLLVVFLFSPMYNFLQQVQVIQ